ncbi:MAG: type II toxin-antitoxin system RelE/ParE family toxin [Bacillota bacterium]
MESENKIYKVIITDEAAQMLVSHARFLAQVSETAALQLIAEFNEKAKSLEQFPERNPWLSDPLVPAGKYRKLLMAKRYLLLYQVKGDNVYVDAVADCRQDYG